MVPGKLYVIKHVSGIGFTYCTLEVGDIFLCLGDVSETVLDLNIGSSSAMLVKHYHVRVLIHEMVGEISFFYPDSIQEVPS